MKKFSKVILLMSILICSACSSSKQAQVVSAPEHKYRLPAKHYEIHQKLLQEQNRLIIRSEYGNL